VPIFAIQEAFATQSFTCESDDKSYRTPEYGGGVPHP
jgi:hypothetical protein